MNKLYIYLRKKNNTKMKRLLNVVYRGETKSFLYC